MWTTLIRTAEAAIAAKAERDYLAAVREFPAAQVRHHGSTLAMALPELPDFVQYNKARGYGPESRPHLEALLAFYRDQGLLPGIEVGAVDATAEVQQGLLAADLAPAPPTVTLHAPPHPNQVTVASGIHLREVDGDDADYVDVLLGGYEIGPDLPGFQKMLTIEHSTDGLRRYVANVDDRPVAAGALFTQGNVSVLVGAATLPEYRGRGCQSALIARRLADAAAHSDLVVATAAFGSPSHDNLARHGFQITQTRTVWR